MAMEDCERLVSEAGKVSKAAARRMLDAIDQRSQRLQREQGLSPTEATARAGQEISDQAAAVAAIQRRNQLLNLQKRMARRARIQEVAETIGGKRGVDLVQALRNTMVAIDTPVRGGRMSAEAEGITWHSRYLSGLTNELDRAGLFQAARSGSFQRQWGRELYEFSMQQAGEPANPGVTGNKVAASIAASVHKYMTWAKSNLNREGAWIGDYAGYITRTAHDGDKMRRAGQDAWISAITPLLDRDRTFEGVDDPRAFLAGVYNALVTGVHLSDEGGVGFKDPAFTGPENIARKLSEARVLHFKDANSWLDYQEQYGAGTLLEQVYGGLGRAAHQQALLSRWGTNPGAEFDQDIRWVQEQYRDSHPEAVDALGQAQRSLRTVWETLSGEANRPTNRLAARINSYLRLDESLGKLGMVPFTHLSSIVNKAGELHYQGVPWMKAYADGLMAPFRNMRHAEAQRWADETLAGMEGMSRDILSNFNPNDSLPGTASRLANLFFRLSGLTWLLNKQKAGAEWAISRRAGMYLDRAHDDLPPEMQRSLLQYDISPREWDALRNAPDHAEVNGRQFLTPRAAMQASDEAIAGLLDLPADTKPEVVAARSAAAREALAMKVHSWLRDTADRSIVTPGVADKALVLQGLRPGTFGGEFARYLAQFKMWPVAAVRQQWGREIYGRPGDTLGKIGGIMNLAVGSMITGYVIMTLKDLMKGKNPRPALDPRTAIAAIMQGGGMGIMGDFLFGEYNRFGQNVGETVLGPVLGSGLSQVVDLWNRIKEKATDPQKAHDIAPDAVRVLTDNLPFINLWYTRQAANYLFLYSLQETMRPGYLERAERRLKQQTGQTMWMSPAQNHLHTFGR